MYSNQEALQPTGVSTKANLQLELTQVGISGQPQQQVFGMGLCQQQVVTQYIKTKQQMDRASELLQTTRL
jgi:hypothetical protein